MNQSEFSNLGQRKLHVLSAIIDSYIASGEPIGSKALSEALDFTVSSATIRNYMAELSELGLIAQPHTSAGRIPSPLGYRLYIDHLMGKMPLSDDERQIIDSMLGLGKDDPERLLDEASSALAELTQFVSLSISPRSETATVSRCEIIPTGRRLAALLLLTSTGILKNRLCRVECDLTPEIIAVFSKLVDENIIGTALADLTLPFVQTLATNLGQYAFALVPLLAGLHEMAKEAAESQIRLGGQSNLLIHPEFDSLSAHRILQFISKRESLSNVLDQHHKGISVMLGNETRQPELAGSSIVFTHYFTSGNEAGAIAIIGPQRMNYSKIIPSLEYFAARLSNLLTEALPDHDE